MAEFIWVSKDDQHVGFLSYLRLKEGNGGSTIRIRLETTIRPIVGNKFLLEKNTFKQNLVEI